MKKSTHPFLQLLVMLAMSLGMLLIVSTVPAVLTMAGSGFVSSTPGILLTQAVTQLTTFLVPVLLMTYIYYRDSQREYYRLDFSFGKWGYALAGVVVLLLLLPAIDWLTVWNNGWNLGRVGEWLRSVQDMTEGLVQQMMSTSTVGGLLANLLVVALIPAVCEEVFFRAGIQNLLQRWFKNGHAAIWVTAVIFSLGHGELFSFMPRLLMGAVLGYLYVYGGSILPNMLAHFVNNAIVVVTYWLSARGIVDFDPEAPLAVNETLTACCALAAVGIMYSTFLMPTKKNSL